MQPSLLEIFAEVSIRTGYLKIVQNAVDPKVYGALDFRGLQIWACQSCHDWPNSRSRSCEFRYAKHPLISSKLLQMRPGTKSRSKALRIQSYEYISWELQTQIHPQNTRGISSYSCTFEFPNCPKLVSVICLSYPQFVEKGLVCD